MDEAENQYSIDLLRRVAEGDEAAFAVLYERFSPVLYGVAFRMMNDAGEAEDVLLEGLNYMWRRANQFDPSRSSAFAWATMIVRNKAIDKLRIRLRGERLQERLNAFRDAATSQGDTSAFEPTFREERARVRSALAELSDDQRQALELSYFSGLTHEEIANQLETPLGTVKARIRRGLLRLRQVLPPGL